MNCGVAQVPGLSEFFGGGFLRAVKPFLQFGNACLIDIKAQRWELLSKLNRQRQANIAQADDGDFGVVQVYDLGGVFVLNH